MFRLDLGANVRVAGALVRFDALGRRRNAINDNREMRGPARDFRPRIVYPKETGRMEQISASDGFSA